MCEKRTRKIKKGSDIIRLREERRMQRLQRLEAEAPRRCAADKSAKNRLLLELTWKTLELMKRNTIIQQKIAALQKETSEFVASVMSDPENKRRCIEYLKTNGIVQTQVPKIVNNNQTLTVPTA